MISTKTIFRIAEDKPCILVAEAASETMLKRIDLANSPCAVCVPLA
jgi:hypothetical protein